MTQVLLLLRPWSSGYDATQTPAAADDTINGKER